MDANEALNSFDLDPRLFYDAISYSTDDYLYIIDMKTDMALVSENMQQDFDLPGRVFEGLIPRWRELIADRDRQSFNESIDDMLCGKTDEHDLEYQVRNRKGEYIWIMCRGLLMRDGEGSPMLFSGAVTSLERKGEVDATTGLFAHGKCLQVLDRLLARERPSGGILLLGLDDFSRINSLNDHSFGNGALRQFAQTLQRLLPENASAFRFDGDEIAVVLDEADRGAMEDLYRAVHAFANRQQAIDGVPYFCTVSGGHRHGRRGRHHRARPRQARRKRAGGKQAPRQEHRVVLLVGHVGGEAAPPGAQRPPAGVRRGRHAGLLGALPAARGCGNAGHRGSRGAAAPLERGRVRQREPGRVHPRAGILRADRHRGSLGARAGRGPVRGVGTASGPTSS